LIVQTAKEDSTWLSVAHTRTHAARMFNGPLSNLDFTEARDSEWQWHQLGHMQTIYTSLKTDNHASTPPLVFYRPDALPAAQPTVSKQWQLNNIYIKPQIIIK